MIEYIVKVYGNVGKCWYLNDKRHREDGPAVECSDGDKHWYLEGIEYTEEEWEAEMSAKLNPTVEMTLEEVCKELNRNIKIVKG